MIRILDYLGTGKLKRFIALLTFVPFDTSTEEGRSNERYRRSILTSASILFSKVVSTLVMLFSIPLTINYLGQERFGLWMIISSFLLFLSTFSDLGLGLSYMNKVSETTGMKQYSLLRTYTSNAIFILCIAALVMILFVTLVSPFINWPSIFNTKTSSTGQEITKATNLLIIIFALGLPFIVVEKFLEGSQKGYLSNIWQSIGNVLSLVGIFVVVYFEIGLVGLVVATLGIPVLVRVVNFVFQFKLKNSWVFPSVRDIDRAVIPELLKPGFLFFVISIFHVIGYNSDNFIITNMLDASSVSLYGVIQKVSLLSLVIWSFTTSLWPAYTEALAREDFNWVKKAIKRTIIINIGFGFAIGVVLTLFGSWTISLWTGGLLAPSQSILLGFSFYIITNGVVGSFAIVYNSSFLLKWQIPLIIFSSLLSIPIKIFLCKHFGIAGVVWGTVISYTAFYILPSVFIIPKFFLKKISI